MQGVDFQAFAEDCTISGRVTMFGERLTDFLNGQHRFRLHKVEFQALEDGHSVSVDSVSLERADLLIVVGTGPRGAEDRRIPLEETRMQLSVGPYVVLGRLHSEPGADPMDAVLQREPMVPLTEATVAYTMAGEVVARDLGTILVNRMLVDWIAPTGDEASVFPEASVRSPFSMTLRKDFTGAASMEG
jgi:hypothetical protein